ncbi:glycosyltransferase family 4 protein, partial [Myxococcota bacterium]|nr:glycosyltransferase family 4 protein [Myxococcota bacterium]
MTPAPRCVLHILNGSAGGAALSTIGLIEELRRRGVPSCALSNDAGTREERERLTDACAGRTDFATLYLWNKKIRSSTWKRPLIEVRQVLRTGAGLASAARAIALARRHGADVVHTNTLLNLEGAATARALGLGHVWHVRELVGPGAPFRFPIEGRALGALLARAASVVVANSRATAERLAPWIDPALLAVVENGIDLSPFEVRVPEERARPVVGMVGSLTSRTKNHALFVDAMARVSKAHDAVFRIYGHVPDGDPYTRGILERARAAGLGDRLELAGFVAEPAEIMRALDVLVHPADNESFGRIVVEAWAAGVPFAGVDGGGVGAIVDDGVTGLLAPPGDAGALARNVERLLGELALRRALSARGRAMAEGRFSIAAHTDHMLEQYARALERPLSSPAEW